MWKPPPTLCLIVSRPTVIELLALKYFQLNVNLMSRTFLILSDDKNLELPLQCSRELPVNLRGRQRLRASLASEIRLFTAS